MHSAYMHVYTCSCLSSSLINYRQDDVVIIEGRSSPSDIFVDVSTQPGPSSRARGVSSHALSTRSPSEMFADQPGSLSPTLDDMESFSSTPSTSYHQSATQKKVKNVDQLISMFSSRVPVKQIQSLYQLSGENFDDCVECLLSGPTSDLLLKIVNNRYLSFPTTKVAIDSEDMWADMLAIYKCFTLGERRLRISLDDGPALDTGGVRRQVYTCVYNKFISNECVHLFEGPENHNRPFYSAESRGSGLFKALGMMIGHSILQDGIGFPYLSPLCYWYIAEGEQTALEYGTLADVGARTAASVTKVSWNNMLNSDIDYISPYSSGR